MANWWGSRFYGRGLWGKGSTLQDWGSSLHGRGLWGRGSTLHPEASIYEGSGDVSPAPNFACYAAIPLGATGDAYSGGHVIRQPGVTSTGSDTTLLGGEFLPRFGAVRITGTGDVLASPTIKWEKQYSSGSVWATQSLSGPTWTDHPISGSTWTDQPKESYG